MATSNPDLGALQTGGLDVGPLQSAKPAAVGVHTNVGIQPEAILARLKLGALTVPAAVAVTNAPIMVIFSGMAA